MMEEYQNEITKVLPSYIQKNESINCKILFLGDYGVGKTSFIKSYIDGVFPKSTKITIGVDFGLKTMFLKNGLKVNLQFWDVAGGERTNSGILTRVYYRYTSAAIVVADVTRMNTFDSAVKWTENLRKTLSETVPIFLFANKCDANSRNVDKNFLDKFCKDHNLRGWYLVSAKTYQNIEESIAYVVSEIMRQISPRQNHRDITESSISLSVLRRKIVKPDESLKIHTANKISKMVYLTQIDSYMSDDSPSDVIHLDDCSKYDGDLDGKCC